MKIIYLDSIHRAIFAQECDETVINGKLDLIVEDGDGKPISAAIFVCGKKIVASGHRDAISASTLHEGTHPIHLEYRGNTYQVGAITVSGNKVKCRAIDSHTIAVETAIIADKSYRQCLDFAERLNKLEGATFGVNILNLNSEV